MAKKQSSIKGAPGARLVLSAACLAATITGWAILANGASASTTIDNSVAQVAPPPAWLSEPLVLPTLEPIVSDGSLSSAPVEPAPAPIRQVRAPVRQIQAPPPIILTSTSR